MYNILPKRLPLFCLLAAIVCLLSDGLGYLPLKFEEPRRALVATEMMLSGNFWVPTLNGTLYYNKPPLFNWLLAALFSVFGHYEWVERLPTLASCIGIALVHFFFFRRKIGEELSAIASLFFLLSGHMLFYFSFQGEIDMTFSFVVYMHVLSLMHFFDRKQYVALYFSSYLFMVLGFMLKGLPAFTFQAFTLLGLFVWHRRWIKLFHYSHFLALLTAFGIIGGYFSIYAHYSDPLPFIAKLTVESSSRTTDTTFLSFLLHLATFPLLLLMLMLPWGLLLPLIRTKEFLQEVAKNRWLGYCMLFLVCNLPLYWLSVGVRDRYLYMFLPFIYSLLTTGVYSTLIVHRRAIEKCVLAICVGLSAALFIVPIVEPKIHYTWAVVLMFCLCGVGYATYSRSLQPLFAAMLLMLSLRFYYNRAVFPLRKTDANNIAATQHAEKILSIAKESDIWFVAPVTEKRVRLPFYSDVSLKEIARLPYQLSYYYSSRANKLLRWRSDEPESGYFIMLNTDSRSVYDFMMDGQAYCLIKK